MNSVKGTERQKSVYMSALALDFDVFAFTETYLNQSVTDEMLFPASFTVYRCDRNQSNSDKQSGGGTLIAINNRLLSSEHSTAEKNEALCVKVTLQTSALFLCCCYIPPTSRNQRYSSFVSFVDSIAETAAPKDDIIVFGDFNLPNLNWNQIQEDENNNFYLPEHVGSESEISIVDGLLAAGLMQICNIPNQNSTFLDLVFTTDTSICNLSVTDPLIKHEFHHNAMVLNVKTSEFCAHAVGVCKTRLKFESMDIEPVRSELANIDWNNIFITRQCFETSIDSYRERAADYLRFLHSVNIFGYDFNLATVVETWMDYNVVAFYNKLYSIFVQHTPSTVYRQRISKRYPEWFSAPLIRLMKDKRRAYKHMRKIRTAESTAAYKRILNLFKAAHKEAHQVYIANLQENLKSDPRSFWKFVNNRRKKPADLVSMKFNSRCSNDAGSSAALFADFFRSVYRSDSPPELDVMPEDDEIFEIPRDTIKKHILKLAKNKSAGPDNVSNRVLIELIQEIVEPLSILFNSSILTGYFPHLWKVSHLTPIHKKGNRSDVENYRGVAIQSAIPKLFESIVYDQLYEKVHEQISSVQHGFLKGKSVVSNLCEFNAIVTDYISKGYQVDCIYTDMSKAFDVVRIESVLTAAYEFGIRGLLLNWLHSYLVSRTQYVKIQDEISQPFNVQSGVPQGSHLGPLLFVLVMNSLPSFIGKAIILIYADDCKLFLPIKTVADCDILQSDLINFGRFCDTCGLAVNAGKCSVMTFTRKIRPIVFEYSYHNTVIPRVTSTRDLGVIFDQTLSFNSHTNQLIKESLQVYALVRRFGRELDDPHAILAIYTGLVRSKLDFASVVWRPQYSGQIQRLEGIQKKFVRFALRNLGWNNEQLPPYQQLCMLVNLDTVLSRHNISDAVFFINVLAGRISSQIIADRLNFNNSPVELRRRRAFEPPLRSRNYTQHEATSRFMSQYNRLQDIIRLDMTPKHIRHRLSLHYRNQLHSI